MKLFTIGPVEFYQSTKEVRLKPFVHFRTDEYAAIVKESLQKLSKFLGNSVPNSLIYLSVSGTGAMEACVENCVTQDDKCLVINGGAFGHRFCDLLQYHRRQFNAINLKWDESLTCQHLQPHENKHYTLLFVNLCETYTGQLYDIQMLSDFCKRNRMMFVVDAISTFLADPYHMERYGVDVTIISSQKGLCLSPGMSFVSLSQRMLDKVEKAPSPLTKYFNFKDYLQDIQRGQTPYTPPVLVMYELQDMLKWIEQEGGLEGWLDRVQEKALYFRQKAKQLGFCMPNYPFSNVLTPLYFADATALKIVCVLKDKYRIFVNPCGGYLAQFLLRVTHIGNTTLADIDDFFEKLLSAVDDVKKGLVE
ncbi:MAG: alanine--glyoxylate aminotransferase family protein [Acetobacter sp.]|nr:alanine--glyoxylate aminotransferase family protein [Acetobacter sp.]